MAPPTVDDDLLIDSKSLQKNALSHIEPSSYGSGKTMMYIALVMLLFCTYKGIDLYLSSKVGEAVQVPASTVVTSNQPVNSLTRPVASTAMPAALVVESVPVAASVAAAPQAKPTIKVTQAPLVVQVEEVGPLMKTVIKATNCTDIQENMDHWVRIAKKPQTDTRSKWIAERIQETQTQKKIFSCP